MGKQAKSSTTTQNNIPQIPLSKKEQERTIRKKVSFLNHFINKRGIITPAAKAAGISRWQVLNWRKEDKEFNEKFIEAEAIACEHVESVMMNQIDKGNTTLTIFYLVNRSKGRWENIQKVEHKADDSTTSKIDEILKRTAKLLGYDK